MIVYLQGADNYLARRTISQIKDKYLQKNSTTELIEIDGASEQNFSWMNLRAVPLFTTSRLVIIREAGMLKADQQLSLAQVLNELPTSTVAVIWDRKSPTNPLLQKALLGAAKIIPVEPLEERQLFAFIRTLAKQLNLENVDGSSLIQAYGNDLWAIDNELHIQATGSTFAGLINEKKSEPFVYFKLIRQRNWKAVCRELRRDARRGDPVELVIGTLASAIRKEISNPQEKMDLTDLLMDLDVAVKTGLLDGQSALALLSSYLPTPPQLRVRWEEAWLETTL